MTAKNLQDDVDKEDLSATTGNSCYKHFTSPGKLCINVLSVFYNH